MSATGTAPTPIPPTQPTSANAAMAAVRVRTSANWFTWIAGLSLVNSAVVVFGGNFHFVVGLGITAVVDEVAKRAGSAGVVLDLVINGFVAGLFFVFAHFGKKAQKWAFVAGMTLYTLDALLLLGAMDILSVAFHAYALYCIYRGFAALGQAQTPQADPFGVQG